MAPRKQPEELLNYFELLFFIAHVKLHKSLDLANEAVESFDKIGKPK
jgi:hypothetical protein